MWQLDVRLNRMVSPSAGPSEHIVGSHLSDESMRSAPHRRAGRHRSWRPTDEDKKNQNKGMTHHCTRAIFFSSGGSILTL